MYKDDSAKYLSTREAATLTGYTHDYISRLCRDGKIPGKKVGSLWLVHIDALRSFALHHSVQLKETRQSLAYERKIARQAFKASYETPAAPASPEDLLPQLSKTPVGTAKPLLSPEPVPSPYVTTLSVEPINRRQSVLIPLVAVIVLLSGTALTAGTVDYVRLSRTADLSAAAAGAGASSFFAYAYDAVGDTLWGAIEALAWILGPDEVHIVNVSEPQIATSTSITSIFESRPVTNTYVTNNPVSVMYSGEGASMEYVRESLDSLRDDIGDRDDEVGLTDLESESLSDLGDVAALTTDLGDLLYWNGTEWTDIATSSLGFASSVSLGDYLTLSEWYATTTDALDEGIANLYYTDARVASSVNASSTIANPAGGASGNIISWNGMRWVSVATSTLGFQAAGLYENPLAFAYPFIRSGDVVSLAFGTTTANAWNAHNVFSSLFAINASSTNATTTALGINNETFTDLTGIGLQNVAGALTLNATGDWTGLFDGQEGSWYRDRANHTGTQLAATISDFNGAVNSYIHASTTIPKAYTGNTFTAAQVLNGGLTLGTLNGPLQANDGVVSATTSIGVLYGGTGLASAPAYGQLLLGNSSGGYTLTATSSLGLQGILQGMQGQVAYFGGTNNAVGTSSLFIASDGNIGIGTTTPSTRLHVTTNSTNAFQLSLEAMDLAATGQIGILNRVNGQPTMEFLFPSAQGASRNFNFRANGTSLMSITGAGNVGIGTTTPSARLSVKGSGATTGRAFAVSDSSDLEKFAILDNGDVSLKGVQSEGQGLFGYALTGLHIFSLTRANDVTNGSLSVSSAGGIGFQTGVSSAATSAGSEMFISSTGNVGIGTTSPGTGTGAKLQVNGAILASQSGSAGGVVAYGFGQDGYIEGIASDNSSTKRNLILQGFGGNVGIGTAGPVAKLQVVGSDASNVALLSGTTKAFRFSTDASGAYIDGTDITGASSYQPMYTGGSIFGVRISGVEKLRVDSSGNVGIGTTTPSSSFRLTATGAGIFANNIANDAGVYIAPGSSSYGLVQAVNASNNVARNLVLQEYGGNVGIGTTTPLQVLTVDGTTRISRANSTLGEYVDLDVNDRRLTLNSVQDELAGTAGGFQFDLGGGTNYADAFLISANSDLNADTPTNVLFTVLGNGNVGIGTTTPEAKLHVNGYAQFDHNQEYSGVMLSNFYGNASRSSINFIDFRNENDIPTGSIFNINNTDGSTELLFSTTPAGSRTSDRRAERMRIDESGRVGIGNVAPSVALDVTGDIEYTGTITDVSDERLKENVEDIDDPFVVFAGVTAKSFNMIGSDKRDVGFLAQDVQLVMPDSVHVVDPEHGYLGVSYMDFIPYLVKAVNEIVTIGSTLRGNLIAWFGDAANGIGDFYANRVRTKELCVGESGNETCITKSQLDALLAAPAAAGNGGQPPQHQDPITPPPTGNTEPPAEPPIPDPAPEEPVAGDEPSDDIPEDLQSPAEAPEQDESPQPQTETTLETPAP